MSLQLIAKQMEAKGRKGDSMLVHMTPGEVEGLQKLAESIGGSLSVNPETGLVEANFLSDALSVIVPAAVPLAATYFGGPAAGAAASALMGGGSSPAARAAQVAQGGAPTTAPEQEVPIRRPYQDPTTDETYPYAYKDDSFIGAYQGGLMSLAEGGETAAPSRGMSGESAAAFDYLMGAAPSASAGLPAMAAQAPAAQAATPAANQMFSFDPATGAFTRNPNYVSPSARNAMPAGLLGMVAGGDGSSYDPRMSGTPFDTMTDAQKAQYYADNPKMAAIAQFAQRYNPFASLQEYMDPGFTERQGIINAGLNPNQNFGVPGFDYRGDYDAFAGDRVSPGIGYVGDNSVEMGPGVSPGSGYVADNSAETNRGDDVGGKSGPGADSRAAGGLLGLAKGGMRSGGFVVPADVVSMIGEGNTDAGYKRIKSIIPGATAIKGKDGGQADTVKTSIEGKQPARVAHGEMYIPPETVKRMGGAKKLYAMMDRVRQQATGSKKQIKPVSLKRALA